MVRTLARKYPVSWRPGEAASALMLDSLFNDMGIGINGNQVDCEARKATHRYCTNAITEASCQGSSLGIGHLENMARVFYKAYREGWRDGEDNILR
ncbi:MAG: hypothetical protein HOC20_09635 [Chloroflexi bacterium]|jgi:hypothetical protein|nr:hypothetical protein [Chloroflexota bacterium]